MSQVRLARLGTGAFHEVSHIRVAKEQEVFSGTIAEAFEAAEEDVDFHAILKGTATVGFFKVDRGYPDGHPFAPSGDLGLRAFMIDQSRQGQGIAQAAVRALPAYLKAQYPGAQAIFLTVNLRNPVAIRAYLRGGFVDTGQIWPHGDAGPQHVMRLAI